ncbi:HAD family hydrolase [Synechococcus sp. CBW1107]|uniref:HAD family hydrolase n=1 Tax=Synechococcus sp. CBW1107 TaxID=2789857 RepID=UPI0018CCA9E7|nr:HAD family hydrolase [Synechococcus sp. CBW1107]QPN56322.1 HAD family hydrolase [Synechococcus sp. CBW1107]
MKYAHIIFDLDGTLVDSASEIHEAAVAVCREHGLSIPSPEYIRTMTGSPPRLFFLDHGCSDADVEARVAEFRAHLATHAGDPGCVFPAVIPVLEHLQKHSIRISLATTKPSELAASLLERYGLAPFFAHIQGTDPPLQHKPHPDILHACMEKASPGAVAMVGDTIFDVEAAHNAGIDSIAVCSGAHSPERLTEARPTFLFASLQEIPGILELP